MWYVISYILSVKETFDVERIKTCHRNHKSKLQPKWVWRVGNSHFSHGEIVLVVTDTDILLYKVWHTVCSWNVINQISCCHPPHPPDISVRLWVLFFCPLHRVDLKGEGGTFDYLRYVVPLALTLSVLYNKISCDVGGCVTQYVWGSCVDLSPGYLYDWRSLVEVESINLVRCRVRVYKRDF